jgi:N-ethylmaleimide reductase
VVDAVVRAIGKERVALRFSPWGTVLMELDSDPIATFSYILTEVEKRGIAYVCLTQPRTDLFLSESAKWANLHMASDIGAIPVKKEDINLRNFERLLKTTPKLATGNYDGENCFEELDRGELDGVTFGRFFISNPDLVERIRGGKELAKWDAKTWYGGGKEGYTDYPFLENGVGEGKL